MDEEMITPEQLADYLGLSTKTLSNWRSLRIGPTAQRGGRIQYRKSDVEAWLKQRAEASHKWMAS